VLMGGPVVDLDFATTAPDTQLHVRMWDVAPDGSAQGLVTRGTYRSLDAPGAGRQARFQLDPQGYRFPAGHLLKVEVTANDAPFFQVSNVPAAVTVERLEVTLPLHEAPSVGAEVAPAPLSDGLAGVSLPGSAVPPRLPSTGPSAPAVAGLAAVFIAMGLRRLGRTRDAAG
jgi:hypothetical protein